MAITGVLFLLMASIGSSFKWQPMEESTKKLNELISQRNSIIESELEVPILISPNDLAGTRKPKFIWDAVKGAEQYTLKLKYPSGTISSIPLEAEAITVGSRCEWPWEFPDLELGSYVWWVQAKAGTIVSPWSDPLKFQITGRAPDRPIPILPSGLTSAQKPIFSWSAIAGATSYTLEVDLSRTGGGIVFREDLLAEDVTSGSKCRSVSPIPLSGDLFWRVQAHNDFGHSDLSPYRYFTIVCPAKPGTTKEQRFASRVHQVARKASLNSGGCRHCSADSHE